MRRDRRLALAVSVVLGGLLFWGLRLAYWRSTSEVPFSDMADYLRIARGVLHHWNFEHDAFWRSYKPPALPIAGAIVFGLFGEDNLTAWRLALALLTFISLLWAAAETAETAQEPLLGVALLWVVALSKSSIFWSYKFATEGLAEALLYLSAAAALRALRRPRPGAFFFMGIVCCAALLNRPQCAVVLPLFAGGFLAARFPRHGRHGGPGWLKESFSLCLWFALGAGLLWTPWLARSYHLYGHVVPLTTQGPYTFLWELGPVSLRSAAGLEVKTDVWKLQEEAPRAFKNDYEASLYARKFVRQWLKDYWRWYPKIIGMRLQIMLFDREEIELSTVPRRALFPGPLNAILLDNAPLWGLLGIAGLLVLVRVNRIFWSLNVLVLAPWAAACMAVAYPRMLEPMLPLILFGNAVWLVLGLRVFRAR